jgi:hypothetical protein
MSKRIITVAALVLIAGMGATAAFLAAKPPADTHPPPAGLDRSHVAVPHRPMGAGVGISMQGGRLRD